MKRISNKFCLHEEEKPELCPFGHDEWRTIECCGPNSGDGLDIKECRRCGRHAIFICDFDEEYS